MPKHPPYIAGSGTKVTRIHSHSEPRLHWRALSPGYGRGAVVLIPTWGRLHENRGQVRSEALLGPRRGTHPWVDWEGSKAVAWEEGGAPPFPASVR